jgi:hypothetical protein
LNPKRQRNAAYRAPWECDGVRSAWLVFAKAARKAPKSDLIAVSSLITDSGSGDVELRRKFLRA